MSILGPVGDALQRLRCNAWRFNAETKQYDRVDEDVAVVEKHLEKLERHLEVMNEAEGNYQMMAKSISSGWDAAERRLVMTEFLLRREEKLRAMAEAELLEVKAQADKDSKGGALQSILYMAEAERADQAEKKLANLQHRYEFELGHDMGWELKCEELQAALAAYEEDAKLSRKMVNERGLRIIELEHQLKEKS